MDYPKSFYQDTGDNSFGFNAAYKLQTGNTRGTQTVGYGNTKIDGANNRITIGAPDGSTIGLGSIPGSTTDEFGFFSLSANGKLTYKLVAGIQYFYDGNGNLIQKVANGTTYVYDPSNGYVNVTQSGLLPNGVGGFVAAKPGVDVSTAF